MHSNEKSDAEKWNAKYASRTDGLREPDLFLSDNLASLIQGTDLGLYRIDELSSELQTVVGALKANEFSEILETNFGYQIIYVQKIQDTASKPREAVESEIRQLLYDEFVDNKYQDWLEDLRARSHIRIIN